MVVLSGLSGIFGCRAEQTCTDCGCVTNWGFSHRVKFSVSDVEVDGGEGGGESLFNLAQNGRLVAVSYSGTYQDISGAIMPLEVTKVYLPLGPLLTWTDPEFNDNPHALTSIEGKQLTISRLVIYFLKGEDNLPIAESILCSSP